MKTLTGPEAERILDRHGDSARLSVELRLVAVDEAACRVLAERIRGTRRITSLWLRSCSLPDGGVDALVDALRAQWASDAPQTRLTCDHVVLESPAAHARLTALVVQDNAPHDPCLGDGIVQCVFEAQHRHAAGTYGQPLSQCPRLNRACRDADDADELVRRMPRALLFHGRTAFVSRR